MSAIKVIKRDGTIVDYDRSKIKLAIQKANAEVPEEDRIQEARIDSIIDSIEARRRQRLLVEDIQDMVEQALVAENKFLLAKTYIIYRYTRALVRKQNTTDESITGTASYNVAPDVAGYYFNKIQCFCFTEQTLQPGERIEMPVSFFVDAGIVDDRDAGRVRDITLSYTFHRTKEPRQAALRTGTDETTN